MLSGGDSVCSLADGPQGDCVADVCSAVSSLVSGNEKDSGFHGFGSGTHPDVEACSTEYACVIDAPRRLEWLRVPQR